MNHDDAVQLMVAEQYLLNELSPELREQFEEHFFGCAECANDVRAAAVLIDQSKVIFASESAPLPVPVPATKPEPSGWFAWFRPAFALPVMAVLLAVIAYQNFRERPAPEVLPAAFLTIGSRGGNIPSISARPGESFLLRVTVPTETSYSAVYADIYGPTGKREWSLKLPYTTENDSYFLAVPAGRRESGVYTVAIRGIGADGSSTEVGRSSFELTQVK